MDQLQAKELELLQLKTEMETSQGAEQARQLFISSFSSAVVTMI